jgi:hypothetical protein
MAEDAYARNEAEIDMEASARPLVEAIRAFRRPDPASC